MPRSFIYTTWRNITRYVSDGGDDDNDGWMDGSRRHQESGALNCFWFARENSVHVAANSFVFQCLGKIWSHLT